MSDIPFIVNPAAGYGKGARTVPAIRRLLSGLGRSGSFWVTRQPGEATRIARSLARSGAERVLIVGGDGTIQEAANAVAGTRTALGIIPAGSGNDLARALAIPKDTAVALELALRGDIRSVDVGRLNGKVFVNGVGVGFDAQAGAEKEKVALFRGFGAYLCGFAKALLNYRALPLSIHLEGQRIEITALMVTVSNGVSCGGGFYLTPDAALDDGLLDVCLVRHMPRSRLLWHLPKVLKGTHTCLEDVTIARCRAITVESDGPLTIHADGEVRVQDTGRVHIEVVPEALRVVAKVRKEVS